MRRLLHRSWLVPALLLAASVHAAEPATARSAVAFDRLLQRMNSGEVWAQSPDEARRNAAALTALVPPHDAARALLAESTECYVPRNDPKASRALASQGLLKAREQRHRTAEVRFLLCEAVFIDQMQGPEAALDRYDAAVALARKTGDRGLLADALSLRGGGRSHLGEQALALVDALDAQRLYEALGYHQWAQLNLQSIAIIYRRMGEYPRALEYLQQSRAASMRHRRWLTLISDELQLAFTYEDLGRPQQALEAYHRVLPIARRYGTRGDIGYTRMGMAFALVMLDRPAEALPLLDQAEADFAAVGDGSNAAMIALERGQAFAALGRHREALARFDAAERELVQAGNDRYLAMLYPDRAATHEALGNAGAALGDYKRYLELRERLQRRLGDQRTRLERHRFEARQREFENRQLATGKVLREQQLEALAGARRWRTGALVTGVLLVAFLAALVARQFRTRRRLHALAVTDELTGVANRRQIERLGENVVAQARQRHQPLTLLAFDIDHFKRINDGHGHAVGDRVLARVARVCGTVLRPGDLLGRIGGEEFIVVLPDTGPEDSLHVAERLRRTIEQLDLGDVAPGLRVSISIGLARLHRESETLTDLTRRADRALYRAKDRGRNRIEAEPDAATAAVAG